MLIELKKFKSYPRLSEETTAFNAELWIDGKKAADVENDGKGGCNREGFTDRDLQKKFHDHCKSLPPDKSEYGDLAMDSDLFISLLVAKMELQSQIDKWKKKEVVFKTPDLAKNQFSRIKIAANDSREAVEQYVRTKYPTATIL